ncbi:MAG: WecB/TagA/CpsF family glycosyltransferase [Defluviitaleaceae bacterium]|nr:WecB/TagA/CpsF family glycosyltransferase [Defluviitaleaceae bacterium]
MKTDILGIGIDTKNRGEVLDEVIGYIKANERKCKLIATPNPEMIMLAGTDPEFAQVLNHADLVIPDGVGVVWASKYSKIKLLETVTGCDLCFSVFDNIRGMDGAKVYILGAKPGVALLAKEKMEDKYPGLNICGVRDGFFKPEEDGAIVAEINALKPDMLLVGRGMGKQEKWIYKYKDNLDVNFAIGCGGAIDVMAGTAKRAPKIFRKLGLEWFYRLLMQPSRFFRMLVLPKFVVSVIFDKFFRK